MDDVRQPAEAAGLPVLGPRPEAGPPGELPSDFYPLRLLLQPGGLVLEMDRPVVLIGRHSEADVRLPLPDVSRRHCRFVFAEGRWQVHDLNSLNGVHVNDQAVREATLSQDDRIRIGGFTFVVDLGPAPAEAPSLLHGIFRKLPRPAAARRRAS